MNLGHPFLIKKWNKRAVATLVLETHNLCVLTMVSIIRRLQACHLSYSIELWTVQILSLRNFLLVILCLFLFLFWILIRIILMCLYFICLVFILFVLFLFYLSCFYFYRVRLCTLMETINYFKLMIATDNFCQISFFEIFELFWAYFLPTKQEVWPPLPYSLINNSRKMKLIKYILI